MFSKPSKSLSRPSKTSLGLSEDTQGLSEGSQGLSEGSQRALEAFQRVLQVSQRALQASQKALSAQGDIHMYGRMEFLPILLDFIPYWGRCRKKRKKYCKMRNYTVTKFLFTILFIYFLKILVNVFIPIFDDVIKFSSVKTSFTKIL